MPKIEIHAPDGDERYALDIDSVTIGRNDSNSIIIDEDSMSGDHAELNLRAGGNYELSDLSSTNGTRLNGEKISEPVMLKDGDQIRFGNVEAVYISEISAEAKEELPPQETREPEIATESQTPRSFASMSPFKSKSAKKDALGAVAITLSIIAILAALAVAVMSTTLSAS